MSKRARDPLGKLYRVESVRVTDFCGVSDPLHPELTCVKERLHRINLHEAPTDSGETTHVWVTPSNVVQLPIPNKEDAVILQLRPTLSE